MNEVQSSEIYQVGARYGVKDYFNQIKARVAEFSEPPWIATSQRLLKASRPPREIAEKLHEEMLSGPVGPAITHQEISSSKRLGKQVFTIDGSFAERQELKHSDMIDPCIGLIDYSLKIDSKKVIGTVSKNRILITQHALERLYERENVATGKLNDAIRSTISATRKYMAFSVAADLSINEIPHPYVKKGEEKLWNEMAVQLIPFSSGLLVVEVVLVIMHKEVHPVMRMETRKSGTFIKPNPAPDPKIVCVEHAPDNLSLIVCPIHVGRTYISGDMLRPEQKEYADLFLKAIKDRDLDEIASSVFGTRDIHDNDEGFFFISNEKTRKLKELLPLCAKVNKRKPGAWILY